MKVADFIAFKVVYWDLRVLFIDGVASLFAHTVPVCVPVHSYTLTASH
jgi:hypothetical protein